MANYPGSAPSFSNKSNGQTIDASHINSLQDEVAAIGGGLLNGSAPLASSNSTVAALSVLGNSTMTGGLQLGGNCTIVGALGVGARVAAAATMEVSGGSTFASGITVKHTGTSTIVSFAESTTVRGGFFAAFGAMGLEFAQRATSDMTAPASTGMARIYTRDNGSGKTQLVVRFNTGAVQVLATEP